MLFRRKEKNTGDESIYKKTDFEEALDKALGNDSAPFSEDTTDKIGDLASDMMACLISTKDRENLVSIHRWDMGKILGDLAYLNEQTIQLESKYKAISKEAVHLYLDSLKKDSKNQSIIQKVHSQGVVKIYNNFNRRGAYLYVLGTEEEVSDKLRKHERNELQEVRSLLRTEIDNKGKIHNYWTSDEFVQHAKAYQINKVLVNSCDYHYFEQISRPYSPNKGIAKHNTKEGCDEDGLTDADELEISLANAVVILTKILQKLKDKEVK